MNPKTEAYLLRHGSGQEAVDALKAGKIVGITAEGLESWLRGAFEDGQSHRRAEVEAEIGKLDRYYDQRIEKAYARLKRLANVERQAERLRGVVADAVWWFKGYGARLKPADRRALPDQDDLLALLRALNDVTDDPEAKAEEIPF